MIDVTTLPTVNASLNATAAVLLIAGYTFIRQGKVKAHRISMVSAFVVSAVFLACYLTYHYLKHQATGEAHTRFTATGIVRPIYFAILWSHLVLAIVVLPLILAAMYYALRARFEKHRRVARWAFPVWLYVSVTGVVVYLMLYHLFPATAAA